MKKLTKVQTLKKARTYVRALELKQDVEFKKTCKILGIDDQSLESGSVFDFLYNNTDCTATQVMKDISCQRTSSKQSSSSTE